MGFSLTDTRSLPPLPIPDRLRVVDIFEYARGLVGGLMVTSHATVVLEAYATGTEPSASGPARLVLVTTRIHCGVMFRMLNRTLRRELIMPFRQPGIYDSRLLETLFNDMAKRNETVWFLPPEKSRGAAVFVRKAANDPNLERIRNFNRRSKRPLLAGITIITHDRPDPDGDNQPRAR